MAIGTPTLTGYRDVRWTPVAQEKKVKINTKDLVLAERSIEIDKIPDLCPVCNHKGIQIVVFQAYVLGEVELFCRCPNQQCQHTYISHYKKSFSTAERLSLYKSSPKNIANTIFSDDIIILSPSFNEIYHQSETAEGLGLSEICGVGYRKALEFLIKDYLIKINPAESESIKSEFLGKCIKDRIEDKKLQACAERATWLGNDETHYVKKWESKDITDLKILIKLALHWIESSILTDKYISDM